MANAQTKSADETRSANESNAGSKEPKLEATERERTSASFRKALMFQLGIVAFTVMPISIGLARVLFVTDPTLRAQGYAYLCIGFPLFVVSLLILSKTLQRLPPSPDDCDAYGRHLVGLTFLLLVVGLANAVGTSTLAFDGGLRFSAAAVLEASDPEHEKKADAAHETAKNELKLAERRLAAAERAKQRARDTVARACATPPTQGASDMVSCEAARAALVVAEEGLIKEGFARTDAAEVVATANSTCDLVRTNSRHALFFLLSLSTMMALFGASFYVVNSVRSKRPLRSRGARGNDELPDDAPDSMMPTSDNTFATRVARPAPEPPTDPTAATNAPPLATEVGPARERFDVHAFWSGACFRVGEAVLFTFAFFWLIWTSNRRTEIVWLPVLALFVGMFVKTGEAIIFRLGMRVLSAVESLLPAVPATARSTTPSAGASVRANPGGSNPDPLVVAPAKAR
jgi:hypothetical protein